MSVDGIVAPVIGVSAAPDPEVIRFARLGIERDLKIIDRADRSTRDLRSAGIGMPHNCLPRGGAATLLGPGAAECCRRNV